MLMLLCFTKISFVSGVVLAEEKPFSEQGKRSAWGLTKELIFSGSTSSSATWLSEYYNVPEYLQNAKDLDYPNSVKKFQGVDEYEAKEVVSFGKRYEEFFNSTLKGTINEFIEVSYQRKDKNKLEASKLAGHGLMFAEAAKLILPDNKDVVALYDEMKKTADKIGGDAAKATVTSEMHKKFIDKIMFSKKPIVAGKENEADFTTKFAASDRIYGIIYFKAGVNDLNGSKQKNLTPYLNITIDGNASRGDVVKRKLEVSQVEKNISVLPFEVIADPASATSNTSEQFFTEHFKSLSPRKHTIKMDLGQWNAGGEIELDWTNANLQKLEADAKLASKNAESNAANLRELPEEFTANKFIAKDILTLAKLKSLIKTAIPECAEVLTVVSSNAEAKDPVWGINKNGLGVVLGRYSNAGYRFTMRGKDGNCYFYDSWGDVGQTATGGGKFNELVGNFESEKLVRISCGKAR
jgi:hypothetical protein